jgi:hypothetical protein
MISAETRGGNWLRVTFDSCEVIEERWATCVRQDPFVAIETQADNRRRLKALYIDCGEKDQFNLLYGARRFVRRLNELRIAHRYARGNRQTCPQHCPDAFQPHQLHGASARRASSRPSGNRHQYGCRKLRAAARRRRSSMRRRCTGRSGSCRSSAIFLPGSPPSPEC